MKQVVKCMHQHENREFVCCYYDPTACYMAFYSLQSWLSCIGLRAIVSFSLRDEFHFCRTEWFKSQLASIFKIKTWK